MGILASLFGKSKKYEFGQLQRAVSIENIIKAGVIDRQFELLGCNHSDKQPTKFQGAICRGAVTHILAGDISDHIKTIEGSGGESKLIYDKAQEILDADVNLERLIARVLYDIGSLGIMFVSLDWTKNASKLHPGIEEWTKNILKLHPRLKEVLNQNKIKHPDLFKDYTEDQFKYLFEEFKKRYVTWEVEGTFFN